MGGLEALDHPFVLTREPRDGRVPVDTLHLTQDLLKWELHKEQFPLKSEIGI